MANGNVMTIDLSDSPNSAGINITEELTRTSVWRSLPGNEKRYKRNRRNHLELKDEIKENIDKEEGDDDNDDEGGIKLNFTRQDDVV